MLSIDAFAVDDEALKTAAGGIGLMSVSMFTGGGLIFFWVFLKLTEKPRGEH